LCNINASKQAINDKLQGKIGEYLTKLQASTWLSRALCAPGQHTAKNGESDRNNHVIACNFAKYPPILIFLLRLSKTPFLVM